MKFNASVRFFLGGSIEPDPIGYLLATLAAWLEGLAVATALLIAHPARATRRPRHSAVWLGWESLRRHGTHLPLSPPEACARLRDLLAQAA